MSLNLMAIGVVFSPLIGFILSLCLLRYPRIVQTITCFAVGLAFCLTIGLWIALKPNLNFTLELFGWLKAGKLRAKWGVSFDNLNFVMTMMVTFISFWVHIYSLGYMSHDPNRARYMAYLNFFTFTMLFLITSPTIAQLFVGWEGVGVASYLLISFWNYKPQASAAALKAFIVNRVGDAFMLLGICVLFFQFETFDFSMINLKISSQLGETIRFWGYDLPALDLIGILLFIGAMSKSAQLGLHVWLPEAMEAQTPVSALIHAATMVTAGVFLIVKLSPLYEAIPFVRQIMTIVGSLTALFAAFVALTQTDIKKIIAYSTCSQLGYMVVACGCSAYSAAIFHLLTHAFFKALLFLGAGSVIHAMSGEQDIRKMGGLGKLIPKTYFLMWIGSLALAGFPGFAGYYSKDLIIENVWMTSHPIILGISLLVVLLTAFYSWRLLWIVFQGPLRADEQVSAHIHESPKIILFPLFILAIGSIFGGWWGKRWFVEGRGTFSWQGSIVETTILGKTTLPVWLHVVPVSLCVLGIALGCFLYYKPQFVNKIGKGFLYRLSFNKGYFDQIYDYLFSKPLARIGRFFSTTIDHNIIDKFGPRAVSKAAVFLSHQYKFLQNGYLSRYAYIMLLSTVIFLAYYCIQFYFPLNVNKIWPIFLK